MCLLVVLSRVHPDAPLVVAANRDELLARPALPMAALRAAGPRVLGGRDQLAGGTWLAVNQHGLVAGLTNRPVAEGRDPARRSRGELPLALARHADAAAAVDDITRRVRAEDYNPAWLLVGDRTSLYHLDVSGSGAPRVRALPPGVHVLENRPLDDPSPKAEHVRTLLAPALAARGDALVDALAAVLRSHDLPPSLRDPTAAVARARRIETEAACVHAGSYGTRWSAIVRVPAEAAAPPWLRYADGPPCLTPFTDAGVSWEVP